MGVSRALVIVAFLVSPGVGTSLATGEENLQARSDSTFTNPIISSRPAPDPSVVFHNGWYYLTATFDAAGGIDLWKSWRLTDWSDAEKKKVWMAPDERPMSRRIWAPELQRLGER